MSIVAACDFAAAHRKAIAVLFVDLSSAFASIARQLVFPLPGSADELAHRLFAANFEQGDVYDIVAGICDYHYWTKANGSLHMRELLAAFHQSSWFAMDGVPGVSCTKSGALAGSTLGDLIFLLAFSRVMLKIRSAITHAGLSTSVTFPDGAANIYSACGGTCNDSLLIGDAEYIDDVAQPLIASSSAIVAVAAQAASIYMTHFRRHLLSMNCRPGKSEVLIRFAGNGANHDRHRLFHEMGRKIPFVSDGIQYSLEACASYKHVGSTISTALSMQLEITARTKGILSTLACLRKPFFANDGVPIKVRTLMLLASAVTWSFQRRHLAPTLCW